MIVLLQGLDDAAHDPPQVLWNRSSKLGLSHGGLALVGYQDSVRVELTQDAVKYGVSVIGVGDLCEEANQLTHGLAFNLLVVGAYTTPLDRTKVRRPCCMWRRTYARISVSRTMQAPSKPSRQLPRRSSSHDSPSAERTGFG